MVSSRKAFGGGGGGDNVLEDGETTFAPVVDVVVTIAPWAVRNPKAVNATVDRENMNPRMTTAKTLAICNNKSKH